MIPQIASIFVAATLSCQHVHAFQPAPRVHSKRSVLYALSTAAEAKQNLVQVAESLRESEGVLLVDSTAKSDLKRAVAELEALADPPTAQDFEEKFQGDWTLVCSTSTNADGVDTTKLPFLTQGPIKNIRDSINKCLEVKQRIRSMNDSGTVDRIDHVLEYQPPDTLQEILDNLPDALTALNINPLEVSKGTFTLIHKAEVESVTPVLRTKLTLESIVLSAAGKSQFLDPSGADLLGINVPLGEFLNSGSFDTTYMDDDIRISRGKLGLVDQLRVFVRSNETAVEEDAVETTPVDVSPVQDIDEIQEEIVAAAVVEADTEAAKDTDKDDESPKETKATSANAEKDKDSDAQEETAEDKSSEESSDKDDDTKAKDDSAAGNDESPSDSS